MIDPKQEREENINEFERVFNAAVEAGKVGGSIDAVYDYSEHVTQLGIEIQKWFSEAERDRRDVEQRWLKDLRQYRGEYDPEIKAKMHPKRSKAFLSITRTKTKTLSARETDLLFPANGEKNWSITPTPIPELNPEIIQNIMLQYQQQTGEEPTEELIKKFINTEARKRCTAMEQEMADQLAELRYREIIRKTILSGNIYGTGILKGPLVKTQISKRWLPKGNQWATIELKKILPFCEFVPLWDIYPDMSAREPEDMRYVFQRYVMNRHKVWELAKRDDFNKQAIVSYLKAHPNGDAEYKNHEQDLRALNADASDPTGFKETTSAGTSTLTSGTNMASRSGKYEVKEMWGYISTDKLVELGIEVDEDVLGLEVAANIWMLGPLIIKAIVSPIEGVTLPYHFYHYDKDDTSLWGEGIPTIMRDAQKLFNASVRAMLDNAAISAGPIIEANTDLLDPSEDPRDIYPFRVFLRDGMGMEASAAAIRVTSLPSYTNEFMTMINFFMQAADEITAIPRYMYGETSNIGGAGKTASGLSMLMGAANVTLKDQVKNFDDGITKPFIRALYFWNMEFNSKEHIKGDFSIQSRGSTSLIAREVRQENLNQFLNITNNEIDLQYTQRDKVLREMVKILDLDDLELLKDENTIKIEGEARQKQAAADKKFEQDLAMLKAKSGGHMSQPPVQATTPSMGPEAQQMEGA
ncbi:MAG: hypothetical protein KAV87_64630 [Desulfobacteraceae bacterium]|nr:hypothetical protein [Desulfobacteraceae bacterium]